MPILSGNVFTVPVAGSPWTELDAAELRWGLKLKKN